MSKARSRARRLAMQGLYEWHMSGNLPSKIFASAVENDNLDNLDVEYYEAILKGTYKCINEVDSAFEPFLNRTKDETDPIELSILRLACYELIYRIDVPYRVVINEAIELAKKFGAEAGHKFINGILDQAAAKLRQLEQKNSRKT